MARKWNQHHPNISSWAPVHIYEMKYKGIYTDVMAAFCIEFNARSTLHSISHNR